MWTTVPILWQRHDCCEAWVCSRVTFRHGTSAALSSNWPLERRDILLIQLKGLPCNVLYLATYSRHFCRKNTLINLYKNCLSLIKLVLLIHINKTEGFIIFQWNCFHARWLCRTCLLIHDWTRLSPAAPGCDWYNCLTCTGSLESWMAAQTPPEQWSRFCYFSFSCSSFLKTSPSQLHQERSPGVVVFPCLISLLGVWCYRWRHIWHPDFLRLIVLQSSRKNSTILLCRSLIATDFSWLILTALALHSASLHLGRGDIIQWNLDAAFFQTSLKQYRRWKCEKTTAFHSPPKKSLMSRFSGRRDEALYIASLFGFKFNRHLIETSSSSCPLGQIVYGPHQNIHECISTVVLIMSSCSRHVSPNHLETVKIEVIWKMPTIQTDQSSSHEDDEYDVRESRLFLYISVSVCVCEWILA